MRASDVPRDAEPSKVTVELTFAGFGSATKFAVGWFDAAETVSDFEVEAAFPNESLTVSFTT